MAVLAAIARPAAARRNGGYCGRFDVFASEECWRKELIRGGDLQSTRADDPKRTGFGSPKRYFPAMRKAVRRSKWRFRCWIRGGVHVRRTWHEKKTGGS